MFCHSLKPTGIVITTAHSWMEKCMKFGQLTLSKIIKIVATSCQILRLICTKFDFGWGSAPYPALPDHLTGFKGPTSKGRGGMDKGGERKGKVREGREGQGRREDGKGEERKGSRWERRGEGLPPLEWRSGYAPAQMSTHKIKRVSVKVFHISKGLFATGNAFHSLIENLALPTANLNKRRAVAAQTARSRCKVLSIQYNTALLVPYT